MLSSIHPLGERARHNRWIVTLTAFTIGSVTAGALVGGLLGYLGRLALAGLDFELTLAFTAIVAVLAALLDMTALEPPGPSRQVNEHWIGHFRGWVYGAGFGAQLGLGLATYVVSWAVYALLLAEFLTLSLTSGLLVGAMFGLGRSLSLMAAGWIDRPSRLSSFHQRMAELGPSFRWGSAIATASLGLVFLAGVLV